MAARSITVPFPLLILTLLVLTEHVACKGCPESKFDCQNGKCIRGSLWCNGKDNCGNGADEISCNMCLGGSLKCVSLPHCVPLAARCNGEEDCADGSDERGCRDYSTFNQSTSGGLISQESHCSKSFTFCMLIIVTNLI